MKRFKKRERNKLFLNYSYGYRLKAFVKQSLKALK